MVKKAPSKLRALDPDLSRFVKDNISNPTRALRDMKSIKNDSAPPPEPVSREDLLRQPGPPRNLNAEFSGTSAETNGPLYTGPGDTIRHTHAASPAPAVSTTPPQPYHAAGSGHRVVFQPVGAPIPPGVDPARDELSAK
jgi:hypothetical protein